MINWTFHYENWIETARVCVSVAAYYTCISYRRDKISVHLFIVESKRIAPDCGYATPFGARIAVRARDLISQVYAWELRDT